MYNTMLIYFCQDYKFYAIIKQKGCIVTALTQQQLFDEVETLPIELKTKMIDTLLTSIHPIKKSIDTLWIQEVKKRKAQIDSGEVSLVDGEEVFRKIASKFTPHS